MRPELSLGNGMALKIVARILPIVALCSPIVESSTAVEDRSHVSAEASGAKRENPDDGEPSVAIALKGGVDSSSAAGPPPVEVATNGLDRTSLVLCGEELELGEDSSLGRTPRTPARLYSR